jgi:short subunit fatty acids transporter
MQALAIITVILFAIVLVIYLIMESRKDQRKLKKSLDNDYKKLELSEFNDVFEF